MIFSTRAEYGVRLMVELGRREGEGPVPLNAIAEAENLPLAYLEHVVAKLKKAGLVTSTRGAHGGYALARPAAAITMDRVVEVLEGQIAPMECFTDEVRRVLCSHETDAGRCSTKLLWTRVQGGMVRALKETTLADLVEFGVRGATGTAERAPAAAPVAVASSPAPSAA